MNILLIAVIISVTITVINSMSCEDGWLEYEGKCFKHFNTHISWTGAQSTCSYSRDAQLATVDSQELSMFVHNNLTNGSDVWIGLSIPDISKPSWRWSDGEKPSFNNIGTDVAFACVDIKYHKTEEYWYWRSKSCTHKKYFICEKEMPGDNCSSDWLSFDTHCYLIKKSGATTMAAARGCWQYDAYLISINSQTEADFIYEELQKGKSYWIGLSPFRWENSEPYQWNNWGDNDPSIDNRCVYMNAGSGTWFNGPCGHNNGVGHHPYICQKEIDFSDTTVHPQTSEVAGEMETTTNIVLDEEYTHEFDAFDMSNIQSSNDNSKQLLLTVVIPVVCGGLIAIILIIVVVILIRRRKRSNESSKSNPPQMNTTYVTNNKAGDGDIKDIDIHQDQEYCIYDEAEVVQADNGTVVVNGDVYAIVDKDKIQNQKGLINMVSQQQNNTKQEIAQNQNHIIVGSDVYAIVDKNNVNQNKQQKPKQKKKKQQTPPKLDEKSSDLHSNAPGHIVVGTDVYAVVDKEKVKPNKQQTSQQKKKKTPAPPKFENKTVAINEGNVYYNEFDMKTVPVTPTKRKPKVEKKTEDTGVVYADLDLTESGSDDRPNRNTDDESGVVYADVRG